MYVSVTKMTRVGKKEKKNKRTLKSMKWREVWPIVFRSTASHCYKNLFSLTKFLLAADYDELFLAGVLNG